MSRPTVRTRFAPSPTGYLHVGTARTALYNYLFARRLGGSFVLRVEDTDVARNVEGGAAEIAEVLRWLGLEWDEGYGVGGAHGPYVQSERLDRYHAGVNALIAHGQAYPCYCTAEELEQRRQAAQASGLPPGYDGHCRDLSSSQLQTYEAEGRTPAVRFRLPDEGETVVDDLIRGKIVFQNPTLTDFVIMRPSGIPTYMFAAVYDDVDMAISHVIRGEDLLPATPRQVHVFHALGREEPPVFAHLPLLVGADRKKLSKRRHQVALEDYRAQGFLPEAMVNYLALLGWGYDETREHFSLADLERLFSIERVSRNSAMFDNQKLEALNGWYIRQLPPEDLAGRLQPFLARAGYQTAGAIERALRDLADERGLKPRKAFQPVRLAITGRLVSPPLFESIELLGRERTLARLKRARDLEALR